MPVETIDKNLSRLKVFYVDERMLLELINWLNWKKQGDGFYVSLPIFPSIPADAVVERVWHEPATRSFGMLVRHESFEVGPPGFRAPEFVSSFAPVRIIIAAKDLNAQQLLGIDAEIDPMRSHEPVKPETKKPFEFLGPPR
jgi:hypothetical protein